MSRSLPALALMAGCQGRSASDSPSGTRATAIEVRDAHGQITARVVAGRPCRATVEGVELQVGGHPLVAMVGTVRWTGEDAPNGTTIARDGVHAGRIFGAGAAGTAIELFDAQDVAMIRVHADGDTATVVDRDGAVVRTAQRTPAGVTLGDMTITGTDDLLLAAVLGAPEVSPEVRALAACHRLLPPDQKAAL